MFFYSWTLLARYFIYKIKRTFVVPVKPLIRIPQIGFKFSYEIINLELVSNYKWYKN